MTNDVCFYLLEKIFHFSHITAGFAGRKMPEAWKNREKIKRSKASNEEKSLHFVWKLLHFSWHIGPLLTLAVYPSHFPSSPLFSLISLVTKRKMLFFIKENTTNYHVSLSRTPNWCSDIEVNLVNESENYNKLNVYFLWICKTYNYLYG